MIENKMDYDIEDLCSIKGTFKGWIEIFRIIGEASSPNRVKPEITGLDKYALISAEHDIIYFPLYVEDFPEDSKVGQALVALGCFADEESCNWAHFV